MMHPHDIIPARVDHFDCGASMLAGREWQRDRTTEGSEPFGVNHAFQCPCQLLPGILVREKRLRDAECPPVVVGIQELRRDFVGVRGPDGIVHRVVDVHALHLNHK
jgi:hypothetical protein